MSFTVNGVPYTPKTATEHAQTQLDAINALRTSRGESILIASPANAIWLELLGAGSIQQAYDEELYQASQSFNVSTCDDDQVLNLLPITGTTRIPASYSTVSLNVTASSAGNAVVPAGTQAPFSGINFVTNTTTTVPAGTTVAITATADTAGPYLALNGNLNRFTQTITNLQSVTNPANSTQGRVQESITAIRKRLIAGTGTVGWSLDGVIKAIRGLQGITNANVYFNVSADTTLVLPGSVSIPARHARIIIQGTDVNGKIAQTYAERMTAPTDGATTQTWTSLSGQAISVKYDTATNQTLYVKVYYDNTLPYQTNFAPIVQQLVVNIASTMTIGQDLTAQMVAEALAGFSQATITGATVSNDNSTFARNAAVDANKLGSIILANVTVLAGP